MVDEARTPLFTQRRQDAGHGESLIGVAFPACTAVARMSLSQEALSRIESVREAGITLDRFGQVVPQLGTTFERKIATNLLDIRHRVFDQLHAGKHVIYVPGSYDLVHVGHASYILEGIETYLAEHPDLTRDDLYVIALSDDDDLIRGVKPAHLLALRNTEHPRPIENHELFSYLHHHPRLADLASLPVDAVGYIPAPSNFGDVLDSDIFKRWIDRAIKAPLSTEGLSPEHVALLERSRAHMHDIHSGEFANLLQEFQCKKHNLEMDTRPASWQVASWQLLIHQFIGNVFAENQSERFIRLISNHDVKYKEQVARVMGLCQIGHHFVDDTTVLSTTDLIRVFGWRDLVREKLEGFKAFKR